MDDELAARSSAAQALMSDFDTWAALAAHGIEDPERHEGALFLPVISLGAILRADAIDAAYGGRGGKFYKFTAMAETLSQYIELGAVSVQRPELGGVCTLTDAGRKLLAQLIEENPPPVVEPFPDFDLGAAENLKVTLDAQESGWRLWFHSDFSSHLEEVRHVSQMSDLEAIRRITATIPMIRIDALWHHADSRNWGDETEA